ncbi:DUF1570 domain-containing protein [Planctomycetota bacterium]
MKRILLIGLIVLVFSWCLIPVEAKTKEEIYQDKLTQLKPKDTKRHYALGLWCVKNKLPEQAEIQFKKVIELKPNHSGARKRLGYIKIKDQWMSPEEITAQGWIKHKGKWITKKEKVRLEAIKKLGTYKGVLEKPGADKENLPWERARTKETEHFIVKTNLSVNALNDICFLMECVYLTWQDFFGFSEPEKKPNVSVTKNKVDFKKVYRTLLGDDPSPIRGKFIAEESPGNKSHENHLLTYYYRIDKMTTPNTLIHEGLHYVLKLVVSGQSIPPMWLNEGLATYFGSSKVKGKKLVTNLVNPRWLPQAKKIINDKTCINLKDFINLSQSEFGINLDYYAEGWSLVYFLFNGQNGKYEQGFQSYIEAWKKGKIVTVINNGNLELQDKVAHLKLFEECMGVPMDQLEEEWKEYILKLK